MSAYSSDKKTLAYELGEMLVGNDGSLPPHDRDAAQRRSRELPSVSATSGQGCIRGRRQHRRGDRRHEAPFYLRRVKEALVHFPDPDTGEVRILHKEESRDHRLCHRRRRVGTLRCAYSLRRGPIYKGGGPDPTPHVAAPSGSQWPCCNGGSPPVSGPPGESCCSERESGSGYWVIPRLTASSIL